MYFLYFINPHIPKQQYTTVLFIQSNIIAAFRSMKHKLTNISLSIYNFNKEFCSIVYSEKLLDPTEIAFELALIHST